MYPSSMNAAALGIEKHKSVKTDENPNKSLTESAKPDYKFFERQNFLEKEVFTCTVEEMLANNQDSILKLFDTYKTKESDLISYKKLHEMIKNARIAIDEHQFHKCYSYSRSIQSFESLDKNMVLTYTEFLLFLCLISREIYLHTVEEESDLHIKIESVIQPMLESVKVK